MLACIPHSIDGAQARLPDVVGHVLAVEVDDADVLDPHLVVVVVARRHRVEPVAGDADRDVALGRLEVAALEHGPAHVDDVLAGGAVLHGGLLERGPARPSSRARGDIHRPASSEI